MPINYTNRKGVMYTLYRGKTRTGKPRYYFGRAGRSGGEPVTEIPTGFTISESINGVVSLARDRLSLIQPQEVATVEAELQQHPQSRRYRVTARQNQIEVYENIVPDYETLARNLRASGLSSPDLAGHLQAENERYALYTPLIRFTLLDPQQRLFGVQRMCFLGSVDGWLELGQTGSLQTVAKRLIPLLGTDEFYELW